MLKQRNAFHDILSAVAIVIAVIIIFMFIAVFASVGSRLGEEFNNYLFGPKNPVPVKQEQPETKVASINII